MVLDVIAIIIIGFSVYSGMKKGLVKAVFSTLSFVIALALTLATLDAAFEFAKTTEVGKAIYKSTELKIIGEEDEEKIPEFFEVLVDTEELMEGASAAQNDLSLAIGDIAIKAICSVVLFCAYTILIKAVAKILDALAGLPVLSAVNKLGGIAAGAVNAWIYMIIFTCIITFMLPTSAGETIGILLEDSVVVRWFCNINPLL